jgi:hypothetical protein
MGRDKAGIREAARDGRKTVKDGGGVEKGDRTGTLL